MDLQLGIPPQTVSVAQLIREYLQQVSAQAGQKEQNYVVASGNNIMHGQAPTLLDLYA
jgi:hypothetical protein